jgi:hypothetical protein
MIRREQRSATEHDDRMVVDDQYPRRRLGNILHLLLLAFSDRYASGNKWKIRKIRPVLEFAKKR